jgi:Ca2+-binding EF-hand superfamily protein
MQAVQRLVREQWKVIWTALQHQDPDGEGYIGRDELRTLLKRYDMVFSDLQWKFLLNQCADEEDEWVEYNEFMSLFPPYH